MAKNDIEAVVQRLETRLIADLNTKINALNTEKGDTLLSTVNDEAYFFQTLNNREINYNPFVYYEVANVVSTSNGKQTSKKYTLVVAIVFADYGTDAFVWKRLFRYGRALEETLQDNWTEISHQARLNVKNLNPVSFELSGQGEQFHAIGVEAEVDLT